MVFETATRSSVFPAGSKPDEIGHCLIGWMFFGVGAFSPRKIPDFETTAATDERELAFQLKAPAKIIRKKEAALFVGRAMLRLGMQLTQIDPEVARRDTRKIFRGRADPFEFVRRHDKKKLAIWLRNHDEFLRGAVPPA